MEVCILCREMITQRGPFAREAEKRLRELSRGGQVYVLHNRVQTIDMMYQRLKKLVHDGALLEEGDL